MAGTLELVIKPQMQEILDHLSALFRTNVVFYSPAGEILRVGASAKVCEFCTLLQNKLGYAATCRALDRARRREAAEKRAMLSYRCHAGLHEAIIPVHLLGDLVGYVMIGQLRSTARPPRAIQRKWRHKWGTEDLIHAFESLPRHDTERIDHIMGMFDLLVRFTIDLHLVTVRSRNVLEPAMTYLQDHLDEHLTLTELASCLYRSPSTLSHQFKRVMGKSFKRVQAELVVARAREFFDHAPDMSVSEAAYRLGYTDVRYFSRVFKKVTDESPSAYRARAGGR